MFFFSRFYTSCIVRRFFLLLLLLLFLCYTAFVLCSSVGGFFFLLYIILYTSCERSMRCLYEERKKAMSAMCFSRPRFFFFILSIYLGIFPVITLSITFNSSFFFAVIPHTRFGIIVIFHGVMYT